MVKFRGWVKVVLFFNSYIPLWTILLLKYFFEGYIELNMFMFIVGSLLLLAIFPLFLIWVVMRRVRSYRFIVVGDVEDVSHVYLEYIITYIVPFVQQDYNNFGDYLVVFLLILVIMFVYLKANLLHVNPMLCLFGYNLFKVRDIDGNQYIIFTKQKAILKNINIKTIEFSYNILIGVEEL